MKNTWLEAIPSEAIQPLSNRMQIPYAQIASLRSYFHPPRSSLSQRLQAVLLEFSTLLLRCNLTYPTEINNRFRSMWEEYLSLEQRQNQHAFTWKYSCHIRFKIVSVGIFHFFLTVNKETIKATIIFGLLFLDRVYHNIGNPFSLDRVYGSTFVILIKD